MRECVILRFTFLCLPLPSYIFPLPSYIFPLPSSLFHLPSSLFHIVNFTLYKKIKKPK